MSLTGKISAMIFQMFLLPLSLSSGVYNIVKCMMTMTQEMGERSWRDTVIKSFCYTWNKVIWGCTQTIYRKNKS